MPGEGDLRLAVTGLEPLLAPTAPRVPRLTSPLLGEAQAGRLPETRLGPGLLGLDQTGDIRVSSELGGVSFRPARRFFRSEVVVVRDWRGL